MLTGMLVAKIANKNIKRWAVVAPNYEYGTSAANNFKRLIKEAMPGASIVSEHYPPLGKIDAGLLVTALAEAAPEGIFNALFSSDLQTFVREGQTRGLFKGRTVISLITGEPEYLLPLGEDTPEGWIVTGYPWQGIRNPEHVAFVNRYQRAFGATPRFGALLGYISAQMIHNLLERAKSTDTETLVDVLEDLSFHTIIGGVTMRGIDHQSTLGAWVGETAVVDKNAIMRDWTYENGHKYMHSSAEVRAARKI